MTNVLPHQSPKISIVIATLNSERYLERCLHKIVSQDYLLKEIVIKDGGSVDGTINIIKQFEKFIQYWESTPDRGIYHAWNHALPHCSGEWICFIGSDDYFLNNHVLRRFADFLRKVPPKIKIVYGLNHVINSREEVLYTIGRPWEEISNQFKQTMCLPHPGLMHHASLFKEHGRFNTALDIAGDYEFLLRELKNNEALFWSESTCATPLGGISTLPSNALKCLLEIKLARKLNGFHRVPFQWKIQWFVTLIRIFIWNRIGENYARSLFDIMRRVRGKDPYWKRAV